MRYYGFGNYYLSSIQQGIQAAHVVKGLWTEYNKKSAQYKKGHKWAKKHKTMVLLNGGNAGNLKRLYELFASLKDKGMKLPFAKFNEDEESLNGALTAIGIVLPKRYYNVMGELRNVRGKKKKYAKYIQSLTDNGWEDWEIELVTEIYGYSLAS